MANAANKAYYSALKDTKQSPAPEPHRPPGKNKRPRPIELWERYRWPEGHSLFARMSKADAEGWTPWRRLKRYRTLDEAVAALDKLKRCDRGVIEWQREIRQEVPDGGR